MGVIKTDFKKLKMIVNGYRKYGIELPIICKYKRVPNRIYHVSHFNDGEVLMLYNAFSKHQGVMLGKAQYVSLEGTFFPRYIFPDEYTPIRYLKEDNND